MPLPDPDVAIRAPGPWTHRDVPANGARFHVVDIGDGPAVVLLHGFPTFWWTWRRQLTALAEAGYRAVAMDLRGYGGSDHPPHGYDPRTLAADVSSVIRSLGESDAVIVGHGWGGLAAWSTAVLEPDTVRAIVPVSMPHPRQLRRAILRHRQQRSALRYALGFQLPFAPERSLSAHDAQRVADLIGQWSHDPTWLDDATASAYRCAFLRWPTPHTAVEYHRWAVRSVLRPDGLSFMSLMEAPIQQRVLQLHGAHDPMVLAGSVDGSEAYVRGAYTRIDLEAGHFPHEERPEEFTAALVGWLDDLPEQ
ncbi:MAG: alpha/beta hydrolase [Actinobacteria bacterium]|nr:alpha/beta hydrolase [Actinomycetota bacterium]